MNLQSVLHVFVCVYVCLRFCDRYIDWLETLYSNIVANVDDFFSNKQKLFGKQLKTLMELVFVYIFQTKNRPKT